MRDASGARQHYSAAFIYNREEIEGILREAGYSWRIDATNFETEYTRNKIRLSVLPLLEKELNPQAAAHIAGVSGQLQKVQDYVKRQVGRAAQRCIVTDSNEVRLLLAPFFEEEELIRTELVKTAIERCCGSRRDIGSIHIEEVVNLCEKGCGRQIDLPHGAMAALSGRDRKVYSKMWERKRYFAKGKAGAYFGSGQDHCGRFSHPHRSFWE